jgi:hypothetical protein
MRPLDRWHEQIEWEIVAAFHDGYRAALDDIAARHAELAATWRPVGRQRYRDKVADRVAEMERLAGRLRGELDRRAADPDWPAVAVPGRCPTGAGSTGAPQKAAPQKAAPHTAAAQKAARRAA